MQGDISSSMKMKFAASDLAPAIAYDGNQPTKKVVRIGVASKDSTSDASKKSFGLISALFVGILIAILWQ
jgi:hypothetical protein